VQVVFAILIALSYVVSPVVLIWGWARWTGQPKSRTVASILSLVGFSFATASAALAVSSVAYAQIHHFGFYDPLLLRIFRWGFLLSMTGILFGIGGVWRQSSLRWHAPISGLGTLAFWVLAAEGEKLSRSGDSTSMRFFSASVLVNKCYRDFSKTIGFQSLLHHGSSPA
jgi:hypothetical protein